LVAAACSFATVGAVRSWSVARSPFVGADDDPVEISGHRVEHMLCDRRRIQAGGEDRRAHRHRVVDGM
jgi:hypothetical protein